jgi:hypothetical protein
MELAGFSNTVTNVFLLIARPLQQETIASLLFFFSINVAELDPSKNGVSGPTFVWTALFGLLNLF